MENNKLQKNNQGIFAKVKKFFKNLFYKEKGDILQQTEKIEEKNDFSSIKIDQETKEKYRLLELKNKFDNNLIREEDISEKDKEALIKLYDEETEEINADTQKKIEEIKKLLNL